MEPGSFQWCPVTGGEGWAHTETQEVPSEHGETLFHCEGSQALAQVASALVQVAQEVVESPFLGIFKSCLDAVLGN